MQTEFLVAAPAGSRFARLSVRDYVSTLALVSVAVLGVFFHFYKLEALPMGFYVDESSIGYNAYLIATTGADEHGASWPLFFQAFGEYKNPLYIYFLAGLYWLFGYSEWMTRAASAICWLMGSAFLFELGKRLLTDSSSRVYLAISLAFTPWLFAISRVSFELVVLYPLLSLHLLALHRGYDERSYGWAIVAGAAIALCTYAYSTFRLLAPLHILLVIACYPGKRYWPLHVAFMLAAALVVLPYVGFLLNDVDKLTARFKEISYIHDESMSLSTKLQAFLGRYLGYFSSDFLIGVGDSNKRHHTGYGGEVLLGSAALAAAAVALGFESGDWRRKPFFRYLVAGLLMAPVAAALTNDFQHSLRAFSMAIFIVVLSAVGMQYLMERPQRLAGRAALCVTAVGALLYVHHYFSAYPSQSAAAFENYGLKEALHAATSKSSGRVILSHDDNQPYINLKFLGIALGEQQRWAVGARGDAKPGDVFIYYDPNRSAPDRRPVLAPEGLYAMEMIDS